MTSLFLRMFLWFCGIAVVISLLIIIGFLTDSPAALLTNWRDLGQRAVVLTAQESADAYEQGGAQALSQRLRRATDGLGIRTALLDDSGNDLAGTGFKLDAQSLGDLSSAASGPELTIADRANGIAGVRVKGASGRSYIFAVVLPRREPGIWGRTFVISFVCAGALLCYLLARSVASPVTHLRQLTRQFSKGDLATRVTTPAVLSRRDEIGELARDFNHMAAQIESLMQAQRRLIADVAHELRSPMTRLGLALGLMRRAASVDGASIARMSRELDRLNALTSQLLTLSRLEHLDAPGPRETLDLAATVREIAADANFEATSLGVSVRLADCDPCSIQSTPELVRSAIENLVRNAVKYTGPQTEVCVRLKHLPQERRAEILVQDQGPGVPESELTHIFEPFFRIDAARDSHTGGAGLGLAITRRIAHLHGGLVTAANRDGGGLEFRLTLPL